MHEKFKLFLAFISLPRSLRNMILKFWPFYSRIFAFWACVGPLSPVRAHHRDSGNHLEQTHAIYSLQWFLKSHPLRDTSLLPKKSDQFDGARSRFSITCHMNHFISPFFTKCAVSPAREGSCNFFFAMAARPRVKGQSKRKLGVIMISHSHSFEDHEERKPSSFETFQ